MFKKKPGPPYWKVQKRLMVWIGTKNMINEMADAANADKADIEKLEKCQMIDWLVRGAYEEFIKQDDEGKRTFFDGYECTRSESTALEGYGGWETVGASEDG